MKPKLWERSQELFWNDEYISSQMLKAHLNEHIDAASRNACFIADSVKWLNSIIKPHSAVLDLGCGPGLYTEKLSKLSYKVTGIDLSSRSINYAKEHDSISSYICGSYLDLDIKDKYQAITMIYCDYGALIKEERKILMSKVANILAPDGIFIFDIFTPSYMKDFSFERSCSDHPKGGFWSDKPHSVEEQEFYYPEENAIGTEYIVKYPDDSKRYLLWDTLYTKESLTKELNDFGFEIVSLFDNVKGDSLSTDSKTMAVICRLRK